MSSRVASEIVSTDRVTRSEQANLRTPTQLSLPGLIGFGNNVVDVFRDHADPIPGEGYNGLGGMAHQFAF